MHLKEKINADLRAILGQDPCLEAPKNSEHGDYATNIAFRLTKELRKPPKVIAAELVEKLKTASLPYTFSELNGFINIRVNDDLLFLELPSINEQFPEQSAKVLLEYVSANPTGPLHIGHGRWAIIGDCLARILQKTGFAVTKEFYINDAGNQINKFNESVLAAKNNQPIPEDGYHGHYIKELAELPGNPVENMLAQQKAVLHKAGADFDNWYSEKTLHASGAIDHALAKLKSQNVLYESEGALWFKTTEYGDDKDRVLVRSNGEKTYFTADIAYHLNKLERGFTKLINIWGADHHGYIPRVQAALQALLGKKETGLSVILGQLVNLFRNGEPVRMSKRTGEMVTFEEVIDEIGVDATRYFLAMRSPDSQLDFDLEVAKKQSNDNPVYYVQYAHARICSILRQAPQDLPAVNCSTLAKAERLLILKLLKLPEELLNIAQGYEIHRLCNFASDVATLFHGFYHECRVITDDKQLTANRLAIIKATREVLAVVFNLLGVSAPEKM